MKLIYLGLLSLIVSGNSLSANQQAQNKETVRKFYDLAFNQYRPREAAERFIGEEYIQHNPKVASGKAAFIKAFEEYFAKEKTLKVEIKRLMADGDLVAVHVHAKGSPGERGSAVVDIFRFKNGKIVEHWDVAQKVPSELAHKNTMF